MKALVILIFVLLILMLATFIYAVGFFVGFTRVNPKQTHKKAAQGKKINDNEPRDVSEKEKKALREWKNFLNYDGATPDETKV